MTNTATTYRYQGHCECGTVRFQLSLPEPLPQYDPRACDCDFCQQRRAQYLSDINGQLEINSAPAMKVLTQGSGQANFLCCSHCDELIAVSCSFNIDDQYLSKGTLNLSEQQQRRLQPSSSCRTAKPVSPKTLSAEEKLLRWQSVWMPISISNSLGEGE